MSSQLFKTAIPISFSNIPRVASPFQGFFTLGYIPLPHSGVLHFLQQELLLTF